MLPQGTVTAGAALRHSGEAVLLSYQMPSPRFCSLGFERSHKYEPYNARASVLIAHNLRDCKAIAEDYQPTQPTCLSQILSSSLAMEHLELYLLTGIALILPVHHEADAA